MKTKTKRAPEVFFVGDAPFTCEKLNPDLATTRLVCEVIPSTWKARLIFDKKGVPSGVSWGILATFAARIVDHRTGSRGVIVTIEVQHPTRQTSYLEIEARRVKNVASFWSALSGLGGLGCVFPGSQAVTVRAIRATAPELFNDLQVTPSPGLIGRNSSQPAARLRQPGALKTT